MNIEKIRSVYFNAFLQAALVFEGDVVTEDIVVKIKHALNSAAYEVYNSLPLAYREHYELAPPLVDVSFKNGKADVLWLRGRPLSSLTVQ